ncbi:hypothetical protein BDZ94DRAFT_1165224, partial [Collybia nuda]
WPTSIISWYLSILPQLPVSALLEDRDISLRRKRLEVSYTEFRFVPLFCMRDTPLHAFYRLYKSTCTLFHSEIMGEGMDILYHQPHLCIKDIPDPRDPNPLRYAILASITETVVEAFNFNIKLVYIVELPIEIRFSLLNLQKKRSRLMKNAHLGAIQWGP